MFLPKQWGNLIFIRFKLFREVQEALHKIIAGSEQALMESVAQARSDASAKEAVIQKLLAERR